jgi:hypothetical protein
VKVVALIVERFDEAQRAAVLGQHSRTCLRLPDRKMSAEWLSALRPFAGVRPEPTRFVRELQKLAKLRQRRRATCTDRQLTQQS